MNSFAAPNAICNLVKKEEESGSVVDKTMPVHVRSGPSTEILLQEVKQYAKIQTPLFDIVHSN